MNDSSNEKQPTITYNQHMLDLKTTYTININPGDEHQYFETNSKFSREDRLFHVCKYIQNIHMHPLSQDCTYKLYPEISDPNHKQESKAYNRIHFHGLIKFNTIEGLRQWYLWRHNAITKISHMTLDTIDNLETRKNYQTKDKKIMKLLCEIDNIPYPITHKTNYIKSSYE